MAKKKKELTFYQRIVKIRQAGLSRNADLTTPMFKPDILPLEQRLPEIDKLLQKFKHKKIEDMFAFIMYDIQNNKIRTHIAKYLIRNGCTRIQKSVFLAAVKRKKYMEIYETLNEVNAMYDNEDSIFFVPIGEDILNNMKIVGKNIDFELITNPGNTLFI